MKHRLLGLIHFILIVVVWSSPLLFDWKIILAGIVGYYLQIVILKGCILTKLQFGLEDDNTFYFYLLKFLGIELNKRRLKIFLDYILPFSLLFISILIQELYNFKPILWTLNI